MKSGPERSILPQSSQVMTSMPPETLNLALRPGIRAASQSLQISLEISESGRSPCRFPILRISLAAASMVSGSVVP
ncbi:uncharacterized protein METZ01_LOCUS349043 [marine metagenome]|uniref:Uncharacterized protein n=1 Tax=marine metagenome TaxID=408172 RepID=A0A382REQ3_9ZZZZ